MRNQLRVPAWTQRQFTVDAPSLRATAARRSCVHATINICHYRKHTTTTLRGTASKRGNAFLDGFQVELHHERASSANVFISWAVSLLVVMHVPRGQAKRPSVHGLHTLLLLARQGGGALPPRDLIRDLTAVDFPSPRHAKAVLLHAPINALIRNPQADFPEACRGHTPPAVPRSRQLTFESTRMPWLGG